MHESRNRLRLNVFAPNAGAGRAGVRPSGARAGTTLATVFDLLVVGGGVNGCGLARDAAGRGLDVCLVEMDDLAGATSSASTKLIHGGLRYLEHWHFGLVREALGEREVLLRIAPHLVRPMRFVLPVQPGMRPAWMLRAGLYLYDHLDRRRTLPPTATLDLRVDPLGHALHDDIARGFEYSDCWVDDARLVVLNARDAADRGARIFTRTRLVSARCVDGLWIAEVESDGVRSEIAARALVNAAGPWAAAVAGIARQAAPVKLRLDKGSHIVVRKLYDDARAFVFQNRDGRIVFAIPYERDFTLIGTTDEDFTGDPAMVAIGEAEIDYLLASVGGYLKTPIARESVVWTYSGVRTLIDDGASAAETTREYRIDCLGEPPLVHIWGGKITAYRQVAEKVMALLAPHFPQIDEHGPWTADEPLPGGFVGAGGLAELETELIERHRWIDRPLLSRWLHAYGVEMFRMLGTVGSRAELGQQFGAGLSELEVDWLVRREWARSADDILWRRSKLGLHMSAGQKQALARHLREV